MDDYLALFPSQEEAVRGAVQMKTTLAFLGLEANPKKCVWTPTQELQHLGIVVNTCPPTLRPARSTRLYWRFLPLVRSRSFCSCRMRAASGFVV